MRDIDPTPREVEPEHASFRTPVGLARASGKCVREMEAAAERVAVPVLRDLLREEARRHVRFLDPLEGKERHHWGGSSKGRGPHLRVRLSLFRLGLLNGKRERGLEMDVAALRDVCASQRRLEEAFKRAFLLPLTTGEWELLGRQFLELKKRRQEFERILDLFRKDVRKDESRKAIGSSRELVAGGAGRY